MRKLLTHFMYTYIFCFSLQAQAQRDLHILPPFHNSNSPMSTEKNETSTKETYLQRETRLKESGVLDSLQRPNVEPTEYEKMKKSWLRSHSTEGTKQNSMPFSAELGFGSWWSLKKPKNTKVFPDFSYSIGISKTTNSLESKTFGFEKFGLGLLSIFYNGGASLTQSHLESKQTGFAEKETTYADTSSNEVGFFAFIEGQSNNSEDWKGKQKLSFGFTPVRWVRANYESSATAPKKSEIRSHARFNPLGLFLQIEIGTTFLSRIGGTVFLQLHSANEFQVRLRTGINLSLVEI